MLWDHNTLTRHGIKREQKVSKEKPALPGSSDTTDGTCRSLLPLGGQWRSHFHRGNVSRLLVQRTAELGNVPQSFGVWEPWELFRVAALWVSRDRWLGNLSVGSGRME